jgi:hypothetical protein
MNIQLTLLSDSVRRMLEIGDYCCERNLRSMLTSVTPALCALGMIALNGPLLAATTTAPLVQKADLVYQGGFRVPQGASDTTTFNYGGTAITFNPANNSLFMTGHDWHQLSAEIKIPTIVNSGNIGSLAAATILQSFKDPTEGKLGSINPSDPNSKKIGGHLVYNGKLIVTGYSFYDGHGTQSKSHFTRPLSLSTTGQVNGPYLVGSDPHFVDGYMTLVPSEWQTLFGGPALTGMCCLSIASVQSNGPSISVFDPSQAGQPAIRLLGYPISNPLRPEASTNNYYNLATKITAIVFPTGTRSVLFFGRQGVGTYCYGEGAACGDLADPYKGTHAYPYKYQVWAYDANDLLAVKNGSKQQYAVQPYAIWNFNLPFEGTGSTHLIGGAAYDAQTNKIYLSQQCADSSCAPVIHVFKVQGSTAPTTLDPPSNLRVQ